MEFDAKVERLGLRWLRVKDGMCGRSEREDWVADVPFACVSIHDYHWNGERFGANHGSFNNAIIEETKSGLSWLRSQIKELRSKIAFAEKGAEILSRSLKSK